MAKRLVGGVAVAVIVLVSAGCGGGSKPPSVASLGTTPQSTTTASASAPASPQQQTAVDDAYAACLNAHGAEARVMPGGGVGLIVSPATEARVGQARKACQKLVPKGGFPGPTQAQVEQRVAQMRKLSECMRSNGVPNFPDPSSNGSLLINASSGINPQSASFQAAQKACSRDFPGGAPPPPPPHA